MKTSNEKRMLKNTWLSDHSNEHQNNLTGSKSRPTHNDSQTASTRFSLQAHPALPLTGGGFKLKVIAFLLVCLWSTNIYADCFLRVDNPGSYDTNLVNENAIAHISNFVEKVNPLPPGGVNTNESCFYTVNIVEDARGIIVTVSGNRMNGSGDSRLRGFDGFQQALLHAIIKSDPSRTGQVCGAYGSLLKERCQGMETVGYTITTKRLNSNPTASKQYKIALLFEKRGKPDKTAQIFDQILKTYPNSLEAAYIQLHEMKEELDSQRKRQQFKKELFNSILSVNDAYQRTTLYKEIKVDSIKWVQEMVEFYKDKGKHNQDLYAAVNRINSDKVKTSLTENLKTLTIHWQLLLGESNLSLPDGEVIAQTYFENAEKLGISDRQAKHLNDKLKAAKIRAMMRKGKRDEAEMAIVTWEVEDPDSSILVELQKEFDRPENMVTIPAGQIRHTWVQSFNLDKFEVTNKEFLEFVKANPDFRISRMTKDRNDKDYLQRWRGDHKVPEELEEIPVVFVSQIVATAYCEWRDKRLPTDLEWGLAAGEGKRNYPWGNLPPNKSLANYKKGLMGDPLPGDSHPEGATPEGVMHMAGNVWEWTSTIKGEKGISRGGSYYDYETILHNQNTRMIGDPPTYSSRFTGFRCAK